ncbi:MAG TPA: hypothetical protein VHB30_07590 [Solirubrobacteraceae bacterium]|jgi:hypothetical protein|nr:hypothetical protein [Solirubrobacteraceae bacterium]
MPPKSAREREEAKRQEKLDAMRKQIDEGTLVVRKMTPEEREASLARPRKDPPARRGR